MKTEHLFIEEIKNKIERDFLKKTKKVKVGKIKGRIVKSDITGSLYFYIDDFENILTKNDIIDISPELFEEYRKGWHFYLKNNGEKSLFIRNGNKDEKYYLVVGNNFEIEHFIKFYYKIILAGIRFSDLLKKHNSSMKSIFLI
jgi:hypothetical protein